MEMTTTEHKKKKKKKAMEMITTSTTTEHKKKKKKKKVDKAASSSLVNKKKDIQMYFAVLYTDYDPANPEKPNVFECYDWYVFNPSLSPSEQFQKITPITRMITPVLHGSQTPLDISSISIDEKLYVFKTYLVKKKSSPTSVRTYISVFNTVSGDWDDIVLSKKLKMISPQLIALRGKIFILAKNSARPDQSTVWGEGFDPTTNSLTPLPIPPSAPIYPDEDYTLDSSAVIDDTRFIVKFKFQFRMLIFDVNLWSWSSIDVLHAKGGNYSKIVVSGEVVYSFCGWKTLVYDLVDGGREFNEVKGLELPASVGPVSPPFFPFHRGENNFYLIWSTRQHFRACDGGSVIHCLKFKVDKVIDYRGEHIWQATVDGCDSYFVNGSKIHDCVAMESNRKQILERCGVKNAASE